LVVSFLYLIIKAVHDPGIPFLKTDTNANWILYPFRAELAIKGGDFINLNVDFTKNFELTAKPSKVYLYIKGFKEYRLWINDNQLPTGSTDRTNWKKVQVLEISQFLKEGTNTIKVKVTNKYGPPALWLYSSGLQNDIKTDTTWTVSAVNVPTVSANLANDCFLHPISLQAVRPFDALSKKLPVLILFFLISSLLFWLCNYRLRSTKSNTRQIPRFLTFTPKRVLIICVILWVILFLNNAVKISLDMGFDAKPHLSYVQYLVDHRSIPLANEGWEFFQPPLFYLVSAIVMSLNRLFLTPSQALYSLKLIPFLCGLGQICLAYFAARIVFPNSKTRQSLSVAIAALIPMNIYVSSYFSNESFSALLMGLAILLTIIILNSNRTFLKLYCILGMVIGLAFLTKVTILTILPVIFLVLLYKLLSEEKHPITKIGLNLGMMFLLIAVIAGWFYVRNWMHFGKVFVTAWDYSLLSPWWQDPGFHTCKFFCQFGKVFTVPYFAGTYSFFDSLYSTFWGDSFLGSRIVYIYRPPWNYEYMSAVYLLAIPAVLAIIIGIVCAIGNIIRTTSDKIWLLILGSFFAVAHSIVYLNLRFPYYCHAKAFYGLGAILPISLVFASGFDYIDRLLKNKKLSLLRMVLYGWFGTLIMAILLAFFVSPGQANAVYYSNLDVRAKEGKLGQAVAYYTQFLRNNPDDLYARCQLAKAYFLQQEYDKAIEYYSQAVRIKPDYVDALIGFGDVLYRIGKIDQAVSYFNTAMQIAPYSADAYLHLGAALISSGKLEEAAKEYEKILLIQPENTVVHNDLGVALCRLGEFDRAIEHFNKALQINPQYADAKNNLNITLAEMQKSREKNTENAKK